MTVVLDTCVLFPHFLRRFLFCLADKGVFEPIWSEKIFEEWSFVTAKKEPGCVDLVNIERLLLNAKWPQACVQSNIELEKNIYLPDVNDRHILVTAVVANSTIILTQNIKDFPRKILKEYGVYAKTPDSFFMEELFKNQIEITRLVKKVCDEFIEETSTTLSGKRILKSALLFGLAKEVYS